MHRPLRDFAVAIFAFVIALAPLCQTIRTDNPNWLWLWVPMALALLFGLGG
jgi:hypothetical protein